MVLTVDEYETIRLIDGQALTQEECAEQMNVSRTTVQAIYDSARKKLADVLVNGKALAIRGGSFEVCDDASTCCHAQCGGMARTPQNCPLERSNIISDEVSPSPATSAVPARTGTASPADRPVLTAANAFARISY